MKQFIFRALGFIFLAIGLVVTINIILWNKVKEEQPISFFNKMEVDNLVDKFNFIRNQDLHPGDNIFIGSSKTYRHLNPSVFDSLEGHKNSSYNLATGNFFPFRTIDFALLFQQINQVKGIHYFMELNVPAILASNYQADPIVNSICLQQVTLATNYFSLYDKNKISRYGKIATYYLALAYKYMNLGIGGKKQKPETISKGVLMNNGFSPLNDQCEKEVLVRHTAFLKNKRIALDPKPDAKKLQAHLKLLSKDAYFTYLLDFAAKFERSGNQMIFFIPPRLSSQKFYVMKAYAEKLREQGFLVIDLADMDKFPELYLSENSFDNVHLNEKGATIFTQYLWSEYQENNQ